MHTRAASAMDTGNIDVETFIEEIKKHPVIWESACEEYHDKVKKRAAWFSVCEKFCDNFADKEDKEKNDIGAQLMRKWKGIKDNFYKSEKKRTQSGYGASKGRRYIYARQLSFLFQTFQPGLTHNSGDNAEENFQNEHVKYPPEQSATKYVDKHQSSQAKSNIPAAKRRRVIESGLLPFMNTHIPNVAAPPTQSLDDDKCFFDSLLPAVKTLPLDHKLEFRSEVMNLLKRFRVMSAPAQGTANSCNHCNQQVRINAYNKSFPHSSSEYSAGPSNNVASHFRNNMAAGPPTDITSHLSSHSDGSDSMDIFSDSN